MNILLPLLGVIIVLPLCIILYRSYQGYAYYNRAVKAFGKNNVAFINRSYMGFGAFNKANARNGSDSSYELNNEIRKNPDTKIVVVAHFEFTSFMVCDPEMLRQIVQEYPRHTEKLRRFIFLDSMEKGLLGSEGDVWKKSRGIMSNLFHFDILRKNESIMYNVTAKCIEGLHEKEKVDLFKLGRMIAADIVVESLFGKDFTNVRIGENVPTQEIQLILGDMYNETVRPLNIIRHVLFGRVTLDSKYLISSQRELRDRLRNINQVGIKYLLTQKEKQKKGEPISAFVEAYLNLNDESYYDQAVQQLITFLIAGMDTTGSLIEVIIYQLAEHPEYQDIILESLKSEPNIYTNKKLNNFILETMRLLSPLRYSMAREVVKPFTIGGFKFELGDKFRLCYGAVMTNMKYFDNPWEFKPDRFNNPLQHPNSFMPFSGGARNCIGQHMAMMELRVATTQILKKYRLERTDQQLQMHMVGFLNEPITHHLVKFITRE